ncbi:MAG: glycosyltransferase [Oscillospiraceae bacterium]|nr:glycosyltransferase [Oscillospiraceae bacterium]
MRVGLLITSIGNFGQKGFYNAQEIGLAKELDKLVDEIVIYKLVPADQKHTEEKVVGCHNTTLKMIPSKSYGINGLIDVEVLDKTLDAIVFFSDTQICVPKVYKWSQKNGVKLFPYIGVLESHSTSKLKKFIMDSLFKRNLNVYKKCHCFVKTPTVERNLRNMGVNDITVTPVGLDLSLLHQNYEEADKTELKLKYGFKPEDKVLLFIGRLIEEKQPLRMVEIFSQLHQQDSSYRLLMVGTGPLKEAVDEKIKSATLTDVVTQIGKIPNSDIWELYRFADCFINLNQQEIFGMAILEAMYYGCKVVAWHAPGPDFIIEDGVSGYLVDSNSTVIEKCCMKKDVSKEAHKRIADNFTWKSTAVAMSKTMGAT